MSLKCILISPAIGGRGFVEISTCKLADGKVTGFDYRSSSVNTREDSGRYILDMIRSEKPDWIFIDDNVNGFETAHITRLLKENSVSGRILARYITRSDRLANGVGNYNPRDDYDISLRMMRCFVSQIESDK